jgi:hypothetical protein
MAGRFVVNFPRQFRSVIGTAAIFQRNHECHKFAAQLRRKRADFGLKQLNAHAQKLRFFSIAGKLECSEILRASGDTSHFRNRLISRAAPQQDFDVNCANFRQLFRRFEL